VPCGPDERPLDDLIGEADAITLHVPLTAETRGLMNAQRLSMMKSSAVLINTGRGALVDAAALADALRAARIAGAAIDVLEVEPPPPTHALMAADIPNLLLTPHVAWASEAAQARLASRLIAMIEDRRRAVAA
jgi:glycerate dehydrogenase